MKEEYVKVSIPKSLYKKIEEEIKNKGESSVSDYIISVLKKNIAENKTEEFSEEDEEKVKQRLKALGYMD